MVYLADWEGKEHVFTYGVFGVQHGKIVNAEQERTIRILYELLSSSAGRLDHLRDESHGTDSNGTTRSTTFVAYWLDGRSYKQWFESAAVQDFWTNLPDDAGVWREVMTLPTSRYMFAATQDVRWGLASLIDKLRLSNDEGYWGVYRHRIGSATDTFTSPYITAGKAATKKNEGGPEAKAKIIDIPERPAPSSKPQIRTGRVRLSNPPDNICFVREGQRQPTVSKDELDIWLAKIAPHAKGWIDHLDMQRAKNGVLGFSTHLAHETPETNGPEASEVTEANASPETNQLAFFLDLAHFELAGRSHRGHVHLRKTVMEVYGPGGPMDGIGKAELFVELCILKADELDVEYIGCVEGTGLMFMNGS
ncbi:hypothetical protein MBLNU459_g7083t1 [Dothideomycetes sp. NU459]